MPPVNNFLPFCPTDTGTNLLSQTDYAGAADRTDGNQPGIASSKLNNKAMRQANYITSQLAQFLANVSNTDIVDDATPAKLFAQINACLQPINPLQTLYGTGSFTHNLAFQFFTGAASATSGATYTSGGVTFTVVSTVASGTVLAMRGNAAPPVSGTLTKTSGTGDATINFYAVRAPRVLRVKAVGGGGGGGGGGTGSFTAGADGNNTTFGSTLFVAGKGGGGSTGLPGGTAGTASIGTGVTGLTPTGSMGGASAFTGLASSTQGLGGSGGASAYGGQGSGGSTGASPGQAGASNSGGGGGGGGMNAVANEYSGAGGGSGGHVDGAMNVTSTFTFAVVVGAGGGGGTGGPNGGNGGDGGSGVLLVEEDY